MNSKEDMKAAFITALTDVFKDEDDRELNCIPNLTMKAKTETT